MRKVSFFLMLMLTSVAGNIAAKGIPSEIFKNGKVQYEKSSNTLILEEGFAYSLSKGLVVFNTGNDLRIVLKGNAEFKAALVFEDNVIIESEQPATLSITSNISGSAIKCPTLTVNEKVHLQLLSRNSQDGMYALDCVTLSIHHASFTAETTTASLGVKVQELQLEGVVMEKPKGGAVNEQVGGICFGDGLSAKLVRIRPEVKK